MGSVISSEHLARIERMVQNRKGGEIVAGGERMTEKSALDDFDFSRGSFYPPTVITGVDTKDEIWQEEIFGPVVIVKKFRVSSCPTIRGLLTRRSIVGGGGRCGARQCIQIWVGCRNMDI